LALDWIPIVQFMAEALGIILYRFKTALEIPSPIFKGYYSSFPLDELDVYFSYKWFAFRNVQTI
jgi:hypothetical protein